MRPYAFLPLGLIAAVVTIIPGMLSAQRSKSPIGLGDMTRLDAYLTRYMEAGDFQGVVLVARGDSILFQRAYGAADLAGRMSNTVDHAFRIASLSKTFTAAAIGILVKNGTVALADPVSRFLPDFPNGRNITVEHLLAHQSGLGGLDTPETDRRCFSTTELVRMIGLTPVAFAPGTDNRYSNEGYVVLAAIIEKASGESYAGFLRDSILTPLGMTHTGTMCQAWPVDQHAVGSIAGLPGGAAPLPYEEPGWDGPGSLYSTAGDLLLWMKALNAERLFPFTSQRYPYGWGRRNYSGRRLVEQSGELEGYTAHMSLYLDDRIYFVFLNNVESGMFGRLPGDFEAIMFDTGQLSSPPVVPEITGAGGGLDEFAGQYRTREVSVPQHVDLKEGRLYMHWGDSDFGRPLIRTGPDEFFERAEYGTVKFTRDASGRVVSAAWSWGGDPLVLTREP